MKIEIDIDSKKFKMLPQEGFCFMMDGKYITVISRIVSVLLLQKLGTYLPTYFYHSKYLVLILESGINVALINFGAFFQWLRAY